jgi:hypothetical protein
VTQEGTGHYSSAFWFDSKEKNCRSSGAVRERRDIEVQILDK